MSLVVPGISLGDIPRDPGVKKHDELVSHCEWSKDVRCSHSNKLGDDVMNQGGVGGIR